MSRQLMALAAGVVALGASPVVAGATHGDREGPSKKDFARGTGHFEGLGPLGQTDITMRVDARSGPGGEDAKGRFVVERVLPSRLAQRGKVTCLRVVGNRAVIGGRIERSNVPDPPFREGSGILIQVDDNGEGTVVADRMQGGPMPAPPTTCPDPSPAARLPVQDGDFLVHDSAP